MPAFAVSAFSTEPGRIRREEGVPVRSVGAENKRTRTGRNMERTGNAARTPRPEYLKNRGFYT